MILSPKPEFFVAVRQAREAANVEKNAGGQMYNAAVLKNVLDNAKSAKRHGISYAEFMACCELLRNQDPQWSLSKSLVGCTVDFPTPVIPPRNPELEARVKRLRQEQANRVYKEMVKNVDHALLKNPQETLGAQVKQVRVQVTNVVQLILTVVGTFVFAYKLVDYNLDGATLIDKVAVGLATALLVGFCDFYFVMRQMCSDDAKLHEKRQ